MAFEDLKATMTRGPVLWLVDVAKPFEIETDASNFALGGVLIQEGHPIAFWKSKAQWCWKEILLRKRIASYGSLPMSLETVPLGITIRSEDG